MSQQEAELREWTTLGLSNHSEARLVIDGDGKAVNGTKRSSGSPPPAEEWNLTKHNGTLGD